MDAKYRIRQIEPSDVKEVYKLIYNGLYEYIVGCLMEMICANYKIQVLLLLAASVIAASTNYEVTMISTILGTWLLENICLLAYCYFKLISKFRKRLHDVENYKAIQEMYFTRSGGFWVVEEKSSMRILGTVALTQQINPHICNLFPSRDVIEVKGVSVHKICRGSGLANQLMKHVEEHGKQLGKDALVLSTLKYMRTANKFYKRINYSIIDTFEYELIPKLAALTVMVYEFTLKNNA